MSALVGPVAQLVLSTLVGLGLTAGSLQDDGQALQSGSFVSFLLQSASAASTLPLRQ